MDFQGLVLGVGISLSITTLITVVAFYFGLKSKADRVRLENKIELDKFRKHYEDILYATTEKLSLNKERWMDANHLLIDASRRMYGKGGEVVNPFLESLSIDVEKIKVEPGSVFLMAPIHPSFARKIRGIKMVCDSIGLKCETADEKFISGPILSLIVKKIISASIVIAIVDGRNPNVFYEIGLAHALGKVVLMVASGLDDVPFDIKSQRLVVVDWNSQETWSQIRRAVSESLIWSGVDRHQS